MFFRMKKPKELETILASLRMNLANNYKDNTQADFREFTEKFEAFQRDGKLNEKQTAYYRGLLEEYGRQLKDYTHAKQKTAWTREDLTDR